jgi:glycerol uptake facilitator protein
MDSRPLLASCLAEMLGTFMLVLFGCGAVHVAVLMGDLSGLWQVGIVWGTAIMLAAYVVGPISGAHINPAITVGLATFGLFPRERVAAYMASQLAGAFLAAATLFFLFSSYLAAKEEVKGVRRGEAGSQITAMCYGEYFPSPGSFAAGNEPLDPAQLAAFDSRVSPLQACVAEFLGTAILALVVVAVGEPTHPSGPRNLAPVFIGLTVTCLICLLAPLTQACFNPARDFGPRLFAFLAGWGPIALPGPRGLSFLAVYMLAPTLGAIFGIGCYQNFLQRYMQTHPTAT